jgi:hypothetical protein
MLTVGATAGERVVAETLELSSELAPSELEIAVTLTKYSVVSERPVLMVVLVPGISMIEAKADPVPGAS